MPNVNDDTFRRLDALNNWLGDVYNAEASFSTLLMEAGFSDAEVEQIKQAHLSEFLQAVIDLIDSCARMPGDQRHMVMVWHYGLDDGNPQDFYVIGDSVGVCGERIRQLVNRRLDWYRDSNQQAKFQNDFAAIGRQLLNDESTDQ